MAEQKNFFAGLFESQPQTESRYALPPIEPVEKPDQSSVPTKADIARRAAELGVDPGLALSIIGVESGFNPKARSYKGAEGLGQVMPQTYRQMMGTDEGRDSPWNNVEASLRYLAYGKKLLGTDDPQLLAAGYHAGYNRKELKEGRIPNTTDGLMRTADYARKVAGGVQKASYTEDEGRYRDLTPDELSAWQKQSQPDEEAGRYRDLTDDELKTWQSSQDSGVLGDIGKGLKSGLNTAAQDVRELVGRIPYVGKPIVEGADAVDKYFTGKTSDELLKSDSEQMVKSMSPEMQDALEKKWWDSEKGTFGPAWTDWRSYAGGVTQSLPEQALTMIPAMRLAKTAYAAKVAAGASAQVASQAAARAAMAAGAISEGALGGAQSSREVRDEVLKLEADTLNQSEAFKALTDSGMSFDEAKNALANDLATRAFVTSGVATGLFGGMGDRVIAKVLTEQVGKSVIKNAIKGAAKSAVAEGVFEELPQSALQQLSKNEAVQQANPKVELSNDVANQALGGLAIGAAQGGGMGGLAGAVRRPSVQAAPAEAPQQAVPVPPAQAEIAPVQAPTPPAKPSGPLTAAVEKVAEENAEPRVTVSAPGGEIAGSVQAYQEDGQGNFVARILGDDGQVYQFTQADGVQIAVEQPKSGPLSSAVEQVAEAEAKPVEQPAETGIPATEQNQALTPDAPSAQAEPVQAEVEASPIQEQVAEPAEPTAAPGAEETTVIPSRPAEPAKPPSLEDMTLPELRDRMKYLASQFRMASDRSIQRKISLERREVENLIRTKTESTDGRDTTNIRVPDVSRAGDQNLAQKQGDQPGGSEAGSLPDAQRRTLAGEPVSGAAPDLSRTGKTAESGVALNRRFKSAETAQAFIAKNNLAETHEVKQTGKVQFKVLPKEDQEVAPQAVESPAQSAPAPDFSGRTPEQLQYLTTNGQTEEIKSAAKAELAKRKESNAEQRVSEEEKTEGSATKPSAAVADGGVQGKEAEAVIGGYPVSGLGDKALNKIVQASRSKNDIAAARAEIERRKTIGKAEAEAKAPAKKRKTAKKAEPETAEESGPMYSVAASVAAMPQSNTSPEWLPTETLTQDQMLRRGADGHLSRAKERYIPIDEIDGLDPTPAASDGDDYVPGRPILQPIEVAWDDADKKYYLYAGNHRVTQAKINGDKYIRAFVEPNRGSVGPNATTSRKKAFGGDMRYSVRPDRKEGSAITETPAFKKWFGNSKVVNENGDPLVVYHGTGEDFSKFDLSKSGANYFQGENAFFFTSDAKSASSYAQVSSGRGGSPSVIPVYLSLQNPRVVHMSHGDKHDAVEYYDDNLSGGNVFGIQADGKDGVLIKYDGGVLAVAFEPTQIKSATGNNGNFDPSNPDIRYSVEDGNTIAEFGPVHTEYKNDPKGAIERLMQDRTGEAIVSHPDLGEISLIYGDGRMGLSHIAQRRGENFVTERLPRLFETGTVYAKDNQNGRVFLGNDKKEATIRLDWNGEAKAWLVSAYEKHPDLNEVSEVRESRRSEVIDERTEKPLTKDELRSALKGGVIGPVIEAMINNGIVVLHDTSKTLPKNLGNDVRGIQAVTAPNGKIHLVANTLTKNNARAVMLHEMFHKGGKGAIGSEQWSDLMGRGASLYRQARQSTGRFGEFWKQAEKRVAAAKNQSAVATRMEVEEFLAYAIEEWEQKPESLPAVLKKWVEDIIGHIKAALVKIAGKQFGDVTPAQLAAFAKFALMDVAVANYDSMDFFKDARYSASNATDFKRFMLGGKEYYMTQSGKRFRGNALISQAEYEEAFAKAVAGEGNDKQAAFVEKSGRETLYRGEGGDSGGGNYFTPDFEFAKNFTRSGRDAEVRRVSIDRSVIHEPDKLPFAGNEQEIDAAIEAAKKVGAKAVRVSEGVGQPPSVFVFDKSAIKRDGSGPKSGARYSVAPEQAAKSLDEATNALKEPKVRDDFIASLKRDLSIPANLILHPRQIASLFKEFTPVYQTGISQMETRDEYVAELGKGMGAYDALSQDQKENVNRVLELGRLTSNSYTNEELAKGITNAGQKTIVVLDEKGKPKRTQVPVAALLTAPGEVVRLSDQEITAYRDLRTMFDRALDLMRDQTLEDLGFGQFAGKQNAAKEIISTITKDTKPEEAERLQNVAKFIGEIEQAKRAGYVPFARYGDYIVTVKEKIADAKFVEDDSDHYLVTLPDSFSADLLELGAEKQEEGWRIKKSQKRDVEKLTEKTVYSTKVEIGLTEKLSEGKAENVEDIPSVKQAIEQARKEWGGENRRVVAFKTREQIAQGQVNLTDVSALAELSTIDSATWEQVHQKLLDAQKAKGFRRHFIHSDNVPGYSGDFERAMADYVIGMSGYLSRRQHVKRWDRGISSINDQPRLRAYAEAYRDYLNNPQEELAFIRQIGFLGYIAGVPATAFANLTQVPLLTVPTLSQFAPVPLVIKEVGRAYKEALAMVSAKNGFDMFDPDKAPEDVKGALKEGWDEGAFVPLETFDLMMTARQQNVGRRKGARVFNQTTQVVSSLFTFAERLNRLVTFIAAARLSEKPAIRENAKRVLGNNALAKAEVLKNWNQKTFAEWMVDETQYRMGKANRPKMMRGVGAAILQFKGYMLQTFEAWYRMLALNGKDGKVAFAVSVGTLVAFAGLWGLPGAEDLRKLLEAIYKQITDKDLDLKTEMRTAIAKSGTVRYIADQVEKQTGLEAGKVRYGLAAMANKGLSYPTGVDLSRIGMGTVVPDSPLSAAGIPFDILIGRPKRAFEKGSIGDYYGAAGEFLPNFLKHPVVAAGWAQDGVRDKRGSRILSPDDLTKRDIAMKTLGFQPATVTDIRDYEYAQRRQETAVDALKRGYANKLARTIAEMETTKDVEKLKKLDQRLSDIYTDIAEHNAQATPERVIKIDQRGLRQKVMRESEGVKSTWGRERKNVRGAAQELRGTFGLEEEDE